jgi:hypothetical protein
MTLPKFTAAASLNPTTGQYRTKTAFNGSRAAEVLAVQESTAVSTLYWPPGLCRPWEKRVWCCEPEWPGGRPYCTYSCVPLWWQCRETFTPYSCWTCTPGSGVFEP